MNPLRFGPLSCSRSLKSTEARHVQHVLVHTFNVLAQNTANNRHMSASVSRWYHGLEAMKVRAIALNARISTMFAQ